MVGKGPKQHPSCEKKRVVERRRSSEETQWRERERERERETAKRRGRKEAVEWNVRNVPNSAIETKGGLRCTVVPPLLFFFNTKKNSPTNFLIPLSCII